MEIEKIFKSLIISQLIMAIVIFVISLSGPDIIFESATDEEFWNDILFLIFLIVIQILWFINLYLLYKFKPLGKTLFPVLLIFIFIFILFTPVEYLYHLNSISSALDYLSTFINGTIFAMLYSTNIKFKFLKK